MGKKGNERKRCGLRKILGTLGMMLCLAVFCAGIPVQTADAENAVTIRMETAQTDIRVGDQVKVKLILEGNARLGGFEAFLNYDADKLEFQLSEDPIAGGEGYLRVNDPEPTGNGKERIYEMTFTAIGMGSAGITVEEQAHVYQDDGGGEMSVLSTEGLTLQIGAARDASDENHLDSLKVRPGTLVPEFDPEITGYDLEVGPEIDSLVISAVPADKAATVAVTGNKLFVEGINLVEITVKAENGEARIYRLTVQKKGYQEQPEDPKAEETPTPAEGFYMTSSGSGFLFSGRYEYLVTAAPTTAQSQLPEGYEPYTLELNGEKIPAYREKGGEEVAVPARVLLYVNSTGDESGFYEFDVEQKTMTRLRIQVQEQEVEVVKEASSGNWILYGIIVFLAVFCAFLGTGLIVLIKGRH